MGRIKHTVLGDVTGKVGNIVFRMRGKKAYMYEKPKHVKVSQTKEAKEARSKFNPQSKFAALLNSIPELKHFWKMADIAASSAYHKIAKQNYKALLFNRPTVNNCITTGNKGIWGVDPVTSLEIDESGIRVEAFLDMNSFMPLKEETDVTAIAVICFYSPIKKGGKYFILNKLIQNNIEMQIDELFEIRLPFSEELLHNYYSFRKSILYFTFITKDKEGHPIRFTTDHKCEFVNEFTEKERKASDKIQSTLR